MTMKIADVAPDEAQLVELSEQLTRVLTEDVPPKSEAPSLDLDFSFLDAARTLLAGLTEQPREAFHGEIALTRQEVEGYLDINLDLLESAKDLLRDFIERTERHRSKSRV